MMSSLPVNDAQHNLQELIDQVAEQGKPVIIQGDRGNAILLAEKDWSAIQETLYLLSIPGMGESIKEGLATPIQECDEELDC
ncbi:MAG: type II toxin-antitoxin system Phd/YefM family antitoxin [Aulosira sp. DedQUE10]|nr:type II toxin-antitoxin system Phd/YefM family antitoxin [Aulosira sp. DedQUE10]